MIDKKKVPVKYLTGMYSDRPADTDLLWEIVQFLDREKKTEFTETELKSKTRSRFGTLQENMQALMDKGYIGKENSKYKLITSPWE